MMVLTYPRLASTPSCLFKNGEECDAQTSLSEIFRVKIIWLKIALGPSQEYHPFSEKTSLAPYWHRKGIPLGLQNSEECRMNPSVVQSDI